MSSGNILLLINTCGKNNLTFQFIFLTTLVINLLLSPFAIYKINIKIKEILNPSINKSYSKVTIILMIILRVCLVVFMISSLLYLGYGLWVQLRYTDYEAYQEEIGFFGYAIAIQIASVDILCDALQITQIYEWLVMLFFISFQNGKSQGEIMF